MLNLRKIRLNLVKQKRSFSKKKPKAEDGELIKKKHINEAHRKFKVLMRWEVLPAFALATGSVIYFKF